MSSLALLFAVFASILMGFATPLPPSNVTMLSQLDRRTTYDGRGTWFDVGLGNCGDWSVNSDPVVAISIQRYGNGDNCNQWVHITNNANKKTAYGITLDSCESCGVADLDMSPSLFGQIGNLDTGELSIDWHFMAKGWSP